MSGHYVAYRRRYVLNLRSVYIFTYGMGVCKPSSLINLLGTQRRVDFTVINWSFMQRIVKSKYSATFADSGRLTKIIELARRIDFSRSKSSLRLFAVNIKCRHRYLLTSVHFTPSLGLFDADYGVRIDLGPTSLHTKRRIWQETITALFLTSPECGIPKSQPMDFAQARDSEYPPYLLNFAGSPGERHVENLKVSMP